MDAHRGSIAADPLARSIAPGRARATKRVQAALAIVGTAILWAAAGALPARADDPVFDLKLADGRFDPPQLVVPADSAFQVRVTNGDKDAIEFESFELHRERVVQPGQTITVYIPALKAGSYAFFDDFHRDTPEGAIVSK